MTLTTGYRTDFACQEISLGDPVIFVCPHYKRFRYGTVVDFTEKSFRVEFYLDDGERRVMLAPPRNILKLSGEQMHSYALYKLGNL